MGEKFEFGSAGWNAEVRRILTDSMREVDLTGITFSWCEEFTDPPAHLLLDGATSLGWNFRIGDGGVEVGDGPVDDVDLKMVVDYSWALPFARAMQGTGPYLEPPTHPGGPPVRWIGDASRAPAFLTNLRLHDLIAEKTA